MKLTTFILITVILQVSASSFAQKITLHEKNTSLMKVFDKISEQSGYDFLISNEMLRTARPVSIQVKNMELKEVLKSIFETQPLEYDLQERMVVVSKKTPSFLDNLVAAFSAIDVRGTVVDAEKGEPLVGATVKVKGTGKETKTDAKGDFFLQNVDEGAVVVVSYLGYVSREVKAEKEMGVIKLEIGVSDLEEVNVSYNTGYQDVPKERATGSFEYVDNKLLNRRVSPDLISRLEGVIPDFLKDNRNNSPKYSIRGRSTIFSNSDPLIVVDNFPFEGRLQDINPNDVESVSILKDAAAASIWGVRASNGVIVITTKKGKFNQKNTIQVVANTTIVNKPNLSYLPRMSSAQYIDLEKEFFAKDVYKERESSYLMEPLTPVHELLIKKRVQPALSAQIDAEIESLKNYDVIDQYNRYVYRQGINQQYALNFTGGTDKLKYYMSGGYDKVQSSSKGNGNERFTAKSNSTLQLTKNLVAGLNLNFIQDKSSSAPNAFSMGSFDLYPYARFADDNGNHLTVDQLRGSYEDEASSKGYLDWHYTPLDEIDLADYKTNTLNFIVNPSITYKILPGLTASVDYQFQKGVSQNANLRTIESYYTRNLVNQYSQDDGSSIIRPIPAQSILSRNSEDYSASNLRTTLGFDKDFGIHHIAAIAGAELKETVRIIDGSTIFGYNPNTGSINANLDYSTQFLLLPVWQMNTIPSPIEPQDKYIDRIKSYFGNAAYTYKNLYTASISGRVDETNFFGVKANQRKSPLWSTGASWNLSNEGFYKLPWLPVLTLKATYGFNGNINKNVSAFTTAIAVGRPSNLTGLPFLQITAHPNDNLRWEKVAQTNLSMNFGLKNDIVNGKIEYYWKKGIDLIGSTPLDPTLGTTGGSGGVVATQSMANSANMKSHGLSLQLNVKAIDASFKWMPSLILSTNKDRVTKYLAKESTASTYLARYGTIVPVIGNPVEAIYSYKWAGLNPQNGDPQGYVNGQVSSDYNAIIAGSVDDLVYNGPANPTFFGGMMNFFSYKSFSLSANIIFKMGHYFRRSSIDYYALVSNNSIHPDYFQRWQKTGDELKTDIPSMPAVSDLNNTGRAFYGTSEALVAKADHIRFQDVKISYDLDQSIIKKLPFKSIQIYGYANNLGILWKANKFGIDPDFGDQYIPNPRTVSLGVNFTF